MVVRHPLERLASFYHDKLEKGYDSQWFKKNMGSNMLRLYRSHVPHEKLFSGEGVRFEEFIQYIIDGYKNEHWRGPYDNQCQPCSINFDRIVRLETFENDAWDIVMHQLKGRGIKTRRNKFSSSKQGHFEFGKILSEYVNVSDVQLDAIVTKYNTDFQQFGYNFTRMNGIVNTNCIIQTSEQDVCC